MGARAFLAGVEITDLVVSWERIEQIKEVQLAEATLFTDQMSLTVGNGTGAFRVAPPSLSAGLAWYGKILEVQIDDVSAWRGLVKNILPDAESGTAKIVSENVLKRGVEKVVDGSAGTFVNPGASLLALLRMGIAEADLDAAGILIAGGAARAAGATVSYDFPAGQKTTVLSAVQEISRLTSVGVFVAAGRVTARAFRPYPGGGAGLKFELNEDIARGLAPVDYDTLMFNNVVTVGYPTDQYVTRRDPAAIRAVDGVERELPFSASAAVHAADARSARYFADTTLARIARQAARCKVAGGMPLRGLTIGDRFPVSMPTRLGLVDVPMELYAQYLAPDTQEVELNLVQVFPHG